MRNIKFFNIVFFILILFNAKNLFANDVQVIIEITNVEVNGGIVYGAVFFNAVEFRNEEPSISFELASTASVLSQVVTLPPGEYVVSAYQDRNGNEQCDFNFLGIPRELVAISNYSGWGFPSRNFDRQKVPINRSTGKVSIRLYSFL